MEDGREQAHCASNLCASPAFPAEKPRTGTIAASGPTARPLSSGRNLLGCHGISSAKEGLGRPQPGSALHHLVTALSVKKALMIGCGFCALSIHLNIGDARCTHSLKMRDGTRPPHCAGAR